MGTIDAERPDGKPFNPYVLTDDELARCKELLISRKASWSRAGTTRTRSSGCCAPACLGVARVVRHLRRIHFDKLDGKTDLNMRHVLKPTEGGLGWVDTWCITSGATGSEKLEVAHKWIDFRLAKDSMVTVATEIGWAPCVDVRDLIPSATSRRCS